MREQEWLSALLRPKNRRALWTYLPRTSNLGGKLFSFKRLFLVIIIIIYRRGDLTSDRERATATLMSPQDTSDSGNLRGHMVKYLCFNNYKLDRK